MKGVYLITDLHNGKRYVGATYGDDMIWGRWSDYVKTGHGGNVELKMLDFDYIKENFTYTLLETFKGSTEKSVIEERETWWKKVLLSRDKKFGYNKN
ncbi:MAG: GIY-YIG nuclease family protein [Ruminococcus sp.]|nr:GIY-YIG nuclease family protein [Ruminococcus sp.]